MIKWCKKVIEYVFNASTEEAIGYTVREGNKIEMCMYINMEIEGSDFD